jgi:hypothetical protein
MSWVAALGALIGCGDSRPSGHVELSGKSPAEGSSLAANAICTREVTCGMADIQCTGGKNVSTQCMVTIVYPERAACYAEVQPNVQKLLSCPALTPGEIDLIELCVDARAARPCITPAQADALARTAETGTIPPDPPPPECEFLQQPIPGC